MRSTSLRKFLSYAFRLILVILTFAAVPIALLVYPTALFAHEARFGSYRVYSDEPIPANFGSVIEQTESRVAAMEHQAPNASQRVYLCNNPRRYAFFAFLTRKTSNSLAIGLSVPNVTFMSMKRVQRFAASNQGVFQHTRFEGNPAEVIAHEIAHFNSVHALGFRTHLAQPMWKSEGWAEYQANLAMIRNNPNYDLSERIDLLLDNTNWQRGRGVARRQWESQLLVEFLGEVQGYRLADLSREQMTERLARQEMLAWYRQQRTLVP